MTSISDPIYVDGGFDPDDLVITTKNGYLFKSLYSGIKVKKLGSILYPGRSRPKYYKDKKTGELKNSCGTFDKAYSCRCKTDFRVFQHTCFQLTCPICYQKGIYRTADRIAERMKKIKKMFLKNNYKFHLFHISFNTRWRIDSYESFRERKKELLKILKKENLHGFLVFHGWRREVDLKNKFVPWKTRPNRQKIEKIKVNQVMRPSEHFHFIGINRPRFSPDFYKKYRFTYKNITYQQYKDKKRAHPYIKSMGEVRRTVAYLLSHAGIVEGKHTITWFNQFAYNRMRKINEVLEKQEIMCEECQGFLYPVTRKYIKVTGNFYDGFTWYFPHYITRSLEKPLIERFEKYDLFYVGDMKIFESVYTG